MGELPDEVSHEQRIRIVRRFAADFEDKNLPYVAVMHAPDHANNEKNWHFHLAYYDRPCSRFTGNPDDYLSQKPRANWRSQAMHEIKVEALSTGALGAFVGAWDFTVPVRHQTKCGHTRITRPFAQHKDRDCTKRDFPLSLRKRLAELVNDELEIAGAQRRVDPRRFTDMGVKKEAEEHLGNRSSQMEALGIATPRGVENERRQWQYTLQGIEERFRSDERNRVNEERRWRQKLECGALGAIDHSEVSGMITDWARAQSEANELIAIATELESHLERARSRARKVVETCQRHLEAIQSGRASKRQKRSTADYEDRLREATDHLSGLTVVMATEILHQKRSLEEAARLTEQANTMRQAIENRLKVETTALLTLLRPGDGQVGKQPEPANDTSPAADDGDDKAETNCEMGLSPPAPPLRQSDVELFMKHLVDNNRRIVEVGSYLGPLNPTDDEKRVMSAPNYAGHQHRVQKLKIAQDQHINRLARYILGHPKVIKLASNHIRGTGPRYELLSSDGWLQRTFKGFAGDELIKMAIKSALQSRHKDGDGVTATTLSRGSDRATAPRPPAVTPAMTTASGNSLGQPRSEVAPRTEVMRKIDALAALTTPIICETREGRGFYRLAERDLRDRGLLGSDLQPVPVQTRLRGIYQQQEREIDRLVGYIRCRPSQVVAHASSLSSTDQPAVQLARTAPPELQDLSRKYAQHPIAQNRMRGVLRDAAAAADTREASVAAPSPSTDTSKDGKREPISARPSEEARKAKSQNEVRTLLLSCPARSAEAYRLKRPHKATAVVLGHGQANPARLRRVQRTQPWGRRPSQLTEQPAFPVAGGGTTGRDNTADAQPQRGDSLYGSGTEDSQNKEASRLDYEARLAAELAEIRRPRVLDGSDEYRESAHQTERVNAPLPATKDTPLTDAKEQSVSRANPDPHQEAAKAAAAIGGRGRAKTGVLVSPEGSWKKIGRQSLTLRRASQGRSP